MKNGEYSSAYKRTPDLIPVKATGKDIFYCKICDAPVVDSQEGIEGHEARQGHFPERKEKK